MRRLCLKSWLKIFLSSVILTFLSTNAYASTVGNLPFNTSLDEFKASFMAATFDIAIVLMMATCVAMAVGVQV